MRSAAVERTAAGREGSASARVERRGERARECARGGGRGASREPRATSTAVDGIVIIITIGVVVILVAIEIVDGRAVARADERERDARRGGRGTRMKETRAEP